MDAGQNFNGWIRCYSRLCWIKGEEYMIQIFKKVDEMNWQLVSVHETLSEAEAQLFALRTGEGEFRAEKREGSASSILGI